MRGRTVQGEFSGTIVFYAAAQGGGGLTAGDVDAIGCMHLDVNRGEKPQRHRAD